MSDKIISQKILGSKEEIKTYVGNISDYTFKKYIESGLPARYEDGRWIAHAENIDEFFKIYTRVSMKNKLPQIMQEEKLDTNTNNNHAT